MDSAEGNTLSNHEEDQVFEVENILDMREMNGEKQYLIKWKNYDDSENTWEPEVNLNCPELLSAFIRRRRRFSRSPSISKSKQPSKQQFSDHAAASRLVQATMTPGNTVDMPAAAAASSAAADRPLSTATAPQRHHSRSPAPDASSSVSSPKLTVTSPSKLIKQPDQRPFQYPRDHMKTTPTAITDPTSSNVGASVPSQTYQSATHVAPPENKAQSSETASQLASLPLSSSSGAAQRMEIIDKSNRDQISASPSPSLSGSQTSKRSTSRDKSPAEVEQFGRIKRQHRSSDGPKNMDLDELMSKVSNSTATSPSSTSISKLSTVKYKSRNIVGRLDASNPSAIRARSRDPRFQPALALKSSLHPPLVLTSKISSPSPTLQHIAPPQEPMSWICMLCKADHVMTEVVLKPMPGQSPHTNRIRAFLPTSARGSGKYDLTIAAFLSPNILKRFFDRPASLLTVSAVQDHQSTYNRFRNFLSTNSVAGLIQVEAYPTEVLAILPYTREIAMGWKLDNWAPENMLAIYLEHMPPPVPLLHDHVELGYHSRPSTHSRMMYRWYLLAAVLKFTPQLIEKFRPNTTIEIYGSSKWAAALERACSLFVCKSSKATERVVLFDRYDQSQFKKNLFQLKRSDIPTSFWEFGIHSLTVRSIMKPIQLYPLLRGGYVMTDIPNIMADPDILLRISSAVYQLNANPANGDWAFVLQYDVFDRLREQAIGSPSAKKVQLALILLANIMSENKCRVMREWGRQPADTLHQSSSTVRFMEGLVRCFCYKAESFVLVDDISSMSGYLAVIETCQSTELYGNYKMPRELYNSPRSSI